MIRDIEIYLKGANSQIIVNGEDISSHIAAYTLRHSVGEVPKLTLELVALSGEIDGIAEVTTINAPTQQYVTSE